MTKILVTERALIQRINRKLAAQGERLLVARPGSRTELDVGRYYTINERINGVTGSRLDLEELGREVGAIAGYETLATDSA